MTARLPERLSAPGLGASRQAVLEALKRLGPSGSGELAARVELNVETVREHLGALVDQELVRRAGTRVQGRGRPEVLYALTQGAERLFPRREADLLRRLAAHLARNGQEEVLRDFFREYMEEHRERALDRVDGLRGRARLQEVAAVFTEMGFMAEVQEGKDGSVGLRLCHCPLRELVEETRIPCGAELGLLEELLESGAGRTEYMPAGDVSCSYEIPSSAAR